MKKLIVGCGYLGRRVARLWLNQGDQVSALTRSPANANLLAADGLTPVLGDVMSRESLADLPDVEHLLYAVGFDRSAGYSKRDVYLTGLRNVLERMAGRVERVFYISSTSVYGQSAGEWVDEQSPCLPQRESGRICLEAEDLIARFAEQTGLHANLLRLSGIYGPQRLLARVDALHAAIPLDGLPDAWLNLIHVDDAAQSVLACERRGAPGCVYLVSDDRPVRRAEYFAALARLVNAPEPAFSGTPQSGRAAGLNKRCANRRLHTELQVTLRYPTLAEGLPAAL